MSARQSAATDRKDTTMNRKPTLRKGPASAYEGQDEIIREISNGKFGALISIRTLTDGRLVVEVYRADDGVRVFGPRATEVV